MSEPQVSSTERSFPSEYRGYQMGLIKQTVACAVSDEDFIDVAPELEKAIFSLCTHATNLRCAYSKASGASDW